MSEHLTEAHRERITFVRVSTAKLINSFDICKKINKLIKLIAEKFAY